MKKIVVLINLLVSISMMSQNFEKEWKEVDGFIAKQLPKSALEKVITIYKTSVNLNNTPQIIKSLQYMSDLNATTEETEYDNIESKSILFLESKIGELSYPSKSIVQSLLATKYAQFANSNQWRLKENTSIKNDTNQNLMTKTLDEIHQKAFNLFWESLKCPNASEIPLQDFEAIVEKSNSKYINNLYDFLNLQAIEFFQNEINYLHQPIYKFSLISNAFNSVDEFVLHKTITKDTFSHKFNTVKLFQEVLSKHINDRDKSILIDLDLKRLQFVYNNYFGQDKEVLYTTALQDIYSKNKSCEEAGYAVLELGQQLSNQYFNNQKSDSAHWNLKKAVDLYRNLSLETKNTNIRNSAINRINDITKEVQMTSITEKVYVPNMPHLIHLNYKNLNTVYYKVVKLNNSIVQDISNNYRISIENKLKTILSKPQVAVGKVDVKNPGDFINHTTEFGISALPLGKYALVLSLNQDFSVKNNIIQVNDFTVSNLSYIVASNSTINESQIYVVDRLKGTPIEQVEVKKYIQRYNNNDVETFDLKETYITDKEGKINIKNSSNEYNVKLLFAKNNDVLVENDNSFSFYYNDYQNNNLSTTYSIFLDRAIYRPGQVVYFKGIAFEKTNLTDPKILVNHSVQIELRDVNNQLIETKSLVSNEFGTFNSTFTTPSNVLLGNMSILVNGNYVKNFRVEEYKRPTFEVVFDKVKTSFALGDSIVIKGTGKAFSGVPISNANASYHVKRIVEYPYWKCWWRPMPHADEEIAFGTIKTNEKGEFEVPFVALIDKNSDNSQNPIYSYQITVDIVDVSGETHSNSSTIRIGKIALEASINLNEEQNVGQKTKIGVSTKNLQGEFENASCMLKIIKLEDPSILYQQRYWESPEFPVMSREQFRKNFPWMPYDNEDKIQKFKLKETVWEEKFETKSKSELFIDNSNWKPGAYKIVLNTQDKNGNKIEIENYFTLYKEGMNVFQEAMKIHQVKENYEPTETTNFYIEKMKHEGPILSVYESKSRKMTAMWVKPNQKINIPITEGDKGGVSLHLVTVINNRYYEVNKMLNVNYIDKELDIEYLTFRDKLEPGQNEEWQLKIKSKKGEKFLAEVLANMYDQSLDEFAVNSYSLNPYTFYYQQSNIYSNSFMSKYTSLNHFSKEREKYLSVDYKIYPSWKYGTTFNYYEIRSRGNNRLMKSVMSAAPAMAMESSILADSEVREASIKSLNDIENTNKTKKEDTKEGVAKKDSKKQDVSTIKVRTNLNETVFFYPNLYTDKDGNIIIKFKMNEALTKWKFMTLATTQDLKIGLSERSLLTQKSLMITPNVPRFMRENDLITFSAKVSNMTENDMNGVAELQLYDAISMKSVDSLFGIKNQQISFSALKGQSAALNWDIKVPAGINALMYRVVAKSGNYSDGEENTLPVLTDKMLVTESIPLNLRALQTKTFEFKSMLENSSSPTLKHVNYKLEFTSNPVWLAVQSMPYLMEYPYDCIEQLFSKYYANSLSASIMDRYPKIKSVFESWKGTDAMKSNLNKNQELKTALKEETPWVLQAENEETQRKNIALLFDLNRLASEEQRVIDKLSERQNGDGSWSWFPGGYPNEYMTQYIVEGFGHLNALKVKRLKENEKVQSIVSKALNFIDNNIVKHYNDLERMVKLSKGSMNNNHLDQFAIHYLYTRSFYKKEPISSSTQYVVNYYLGQAKKYWNSQELYTQGMIALTLHRNNDTKTPKEMIKSFDERAFKNEEKGMYWESKNGWYWYQMPIETQSMMIEVYDQVAKDSKTVDELKIWLLKNKQTNSWETTKSTASAIYAILSTGNQTLDIAQNPIIKIGGEPIKIDNTVIEAGLGSFKKTWTPENINKNLAYIEVSNPNKNIAWGACYWQYLETLNNIKSFKNTPLKTTKELYKVLRNEKGEYLELLTDATIHPGDKIRVKIIVQIDREMEYLHLKDMRAAGFEPVDILSGYKWKSGLGYYQSTKDASMNFFIDRAYKGTYILEYDLKANLKGIFSNGITTLQSMYAPEFSSHSQGQEIRIK